MLTKGFERIITEFRENDYPSNDLHHSQSNRTLESKLLEMTYVDDLHKFEFSNFQPKVAPICPIRIEQSLIYF